MLDIRLLRENPDAIKARLAGRGEGHESAVDAVLAIDAQRRRADTDLQGLQAERNRMSKEIGRLRASKEDSSAQEAQVKSFGSKMDTLNVTVAELDTKQRELLLAIPNTPSLTTPVGRDASENPILRTWGEKPVLERVEDHIAIGERLGLFDFERAGRMSGSGFVCYTGAGAKLERALINFLLDLHTMSHGYKEMAPPLVVKPEALVGTGQLPKFADQQYRCQSDDLFLVPTAEVPVTNFHREEILPEAMLPVKYVAYTPCFRREAGSAGLGTRGLIRTHQFDKVELVKICAPEASASELELLTADAETVLQQLGLHYRVIELCTGDLGFGSAKTYDIEIWAPGQNAYLEVSSCSNFGDYQARRMNLRMKGADGKNRFAHTLNGSGTALARLYVAVLECGLQSDGSVSIPPALRPYFGADAIA